MKPADGLSASVAMTAFWLSLLAVICPSAAVAQSLPKGSQVRCDLVLQTATAIADDSKSALNHWILFQDIVVVDAHECVQGKPDSQGKRWCSQLVPDGYVCGNSAFQVYRTKPRKPKYRPQVLTLTYHSWNKDALVFSAYVGGWPEGKTDSEIALGGGASGSASRRGGAWKVVVDRMPEEHDDDAVNVQVPLPKSDAGAPQESKKD